MKKKSQKGITLIALIVTIMVLMILAGISIKTLRDGGIIGEANEAAIEHSHSIIREEFKLKTVDFYKKDADQAEDFSDFLKSDAGGKFLNEDNTVNVKNMENKKIKTGKGKDYKDVYILEDMGGGDYKLNYYDKDRKNKLIDEIAMAEDNTSIANTDYFTYVLDKTNKTATLTGIKEEYALYNKEYYLNVEYKAIRAIKDGENIIKDIVIPNTVTENGVTYDIITIEEGSFCYNKNIHYCMSSSPEFEKIIISPGIKRIGKNAFNGQTAVKSLILPNSLSSIEQGAFKYCTNLEGKIVIPGNVERIGNDAFTGCKNISEIVLQGGIKEIGYGAFSYCENISELIIPNTVVSIEGTAFYSCKSIKDVKIPNGIKNIGRSAFCDCESISKITIPNTVTTIEVFSFSGCSNLTNIELPESISSIGYGAFSECTNLANIKLPESIISIDNMAFSDCNSLKSITIPKNVTDIKGPLFGGTPIEIINVDINNTKYDSRENCNAIVETSTNKIISACKNTKIPSSITTLGNSSYSQCASLEEITIPNNITTLENGVFSRCKELKKIEIPDSVTDTGTDLLSYCSKLQTIKISKKMTKINHRMFQGCTSLSQFEIPENINCIGEYAFEACYNLKNITIPSTVHDLYIGIFCNWKNTQNINIQFKEGQLPSGWSSNWNYRCNAKINYLQ